eukprot:TRINITY_DN629_c2_g1_i1.p1 TRINITY_DN629_c2_g1~~TRINITY_DN629_c2_g1_i1.p1  ORF type:complete len:616 (+),score=179.31 TRINITY_DN629_c2_g1_i1:70-1848(+)
MPNPYGTEVDIQQNEPTTEAHLELSNSREFPLPMNERDLCAINAATRKEPWVRYETLFWVVWIVFTLIAVCDRLWINSWPRESFGKDGYGTDKRNVIDGPWTVQLYDVTARISGRLCITALMGICVTILNVVFNFLSESKTLQKYVFLWDWREANLRIHKALGITLALSTVPHVWSVLFPVFFSSYSLQFETVHETELRFPISEAKSCIEMNTANNTVCIDSDDLGRLIGMTIMFCIMIPITVSKVFLRFRYSLAWKLHVLMGFLYTVDITRRRTHPHTWVLNMPLFVVVGVNAILSRYLYRVAELDVVKTVVLDGKYTLVFLKRNPKYTYAESLVGDVWWFNGHPFTVLSNKGQKWEGVGEEQQEEPSWEGHKFQIQEGGQVVRQDTMPSMHRISLHQQGGEDSEDIEWDYTVIMQVFEGTPSKPSGTEKIISATSVKSQGPYRATHGLLAHTGVNPPLVLIASGSGGTYLVEFLMHLREHNITPVHPVKIYYTARSIPLFQLITDQLCRNPAHNTTVHAALTVAEPTLDYTPSHPKRDMQLGRLSIGEVLQAAPKGAEVHYCGSGGLLEEIKQRCKGLDLKLHEGDTFDA